MVIPHSGSYPHAKFEGNLLLFKFEPHTKSGLTIPQCVRPPPLPLAQCPTDRPTESGWGMLEKSRRSRKEMKSLALMDEVKMERLSRILILPQSHYR